MSISFSNRTVEVKTILSFDAMAALEEALQLAAMDAATTGDAVKSCQFFDLSEQLGIALDIDMLEDTQSDEVVEETFLPGSAE